MFGKKKKRKRKIAIRSLLYMILMGVLMIIGTSVAASLQLFERNIQIYEDYAYSYANMTANNVPGDLINEYLKMAPSGTGISVNSTEADTSTEPEVYSGAEASTEFPASAGSVVSTESEGIASSDVDDGQLNSLQMSILDDSEYVRIYSLLMTAASYAKLRYIYVVVPTEEDKIYIWDAFHFDPDGSPSEQEEADYRQVAAFLEHKPYRENEKEAMKAVMEGEWDKSLVVSSIYNNQALGSAYSPVYDSAGNVVAVVGVDIDLVDMVVAILVMCGNILLAIAAILGICMLIFYFLIRWRIIHPIIKLKKATTDLVENLDTGKEFKVNVNTGDEIQALAESFEEMDVRLKKYLKENMAITAEQEHMRTELDLARRIQADMLPSEFPDRKDFDIYASMTPAKEVGGDFYDFFLIDDDHLALVIADVSGKGIPAALFMMMSMIMLKNLALTGMRPKDVLESVNNQICGNHEEMFVTVWMGILDLKSGVITASNAGHEYPMLKKGPESAFEMVKDPHGLVLGGMEGVHYKEYEMKMEPGSRLFVYTDGVAEATDAKNELFGTDRTLDALNQCVGETPKETLEAVDQAVSRFVGEAPQFDDLTMLCVSYKGE